MGMRRMKVRRRLGAAVVALGLTYAMPASAQGVLNVYCSVQVEWCTLIANEFQKASGIKVETGFTARGIFIT